MSNIQKNSRRVRIFLQFLLVIIPISVIYYWFTVDTAYDFISRSGIFELSLDIDYFTHLQLSTVTRLFAAVASLLIVAIMLYGLNIS